MVAPHDQHVLSALRAATKDVHASLEGTLVLSSPDVDRDGYARYLAALFGWLRGFEDALWSAPWPAELEVASRTGKLRWIEADLRALGVDSEHVPACPTRPPLETLAQRFGAAYVVEGSQLGGQVLARRLGPALSPLVPRYLVGYGDATGPMWRRFVEVMARAVPRSDAEEASRAARATFVGLRDWLVERGVA